MPRRVLPPHRCRALSFVLVATRQFLCVGDARYAALRGVLVVQLSPAIAIHRRMQPYFGAVPSLYAVAEGEYLGSGVAGSLGKRVATTRLPPLHYCMCACCVEQCIFPLSRS